MPFAPPTITFTQQFMRALQKHGVPIVRTRPGNRKLAGGFDAPDVKHYYALVDPIPFRPIYPGQVDEVGDSNLSGQGRRVLLLPLMWQGELVDIKETDRVKIGSESLDMVVLRGGEDGTFYDQDVVVYIMVLLQRA